MMYYFERVGPRPGLNLVPPLDLPPGCLVKGMKFTSLDGFQYLVVDIELTVLNIEVCTSPTDDPEDTRYLTPHWEMQASYQVQITRTLKA